jgi:signal transduction histidine kinase
VRRLGLRPFPVALFAVAVTFAATSVPLSVGHEPVYDTVGYGLMALALAVAGVLVASRCASNRMGWMLLGMGVFSAFAELVEGYGEHAEYIAAVPVQWVASWTWTIGAAQWALVFLWFPSGHLPSSRWRFVAWSAIVGAALSAAGTGLGHVADSAFTSGRNPYAVDGAVGGALFAVGQALFMVAFVAAIGSLIVRFRRSHGVERQQLKWVACAVSLFAIVAPLTSFAYFSSAAVQVAIATVSIATPAAMCVAILRYRLYDVDVVISRTLVYAALTLLLAGTYAAVTLIIGTALGGRHSAWVTAGATLAAAAAFRPLRAHIQDVVDRRFNRARYEAMQQVRVFLEDLRAGRVEPEGVEGMLRAVLSEPGLELRFVLPGDGGDVDARGRALDRIDDGRQRTPVERAGVPLAILVHDGLGEERAGLFDAVVGAAGLAIEIARLRVELRQRLAEVEASRTRIVAAGYEERRRIERDIHDGAQQRLVTIGLALRHAQHELGGSPVSLALESSVEELGLAIRDLRALANGVRPAQLDSGLAHALRDLAGRAPLPVDVRASKERFPGDVEAAAYFIACEGVTNAVKHAHATRVELRAEQHDGTLVIRVHDDGVGGAHLNGGTGLRGLSDRVAAHRGRLRIESVDGEGTTLTAELPCAS